MPINWWKKDPERIEDIQVQGPIQVNHQPPLKCICPKYSVGAFLLHRAASGTTSRCVDLAAPKRTSAQRLTDYQLGGPEKGHHEPAVHEDTIASRMKDAGANSTTACRQLASH